MVAELVSSRDQSGSGLHIFGQFAAGDEESRLDLPPIEYPDQTVGECLDGTVVERQRHHRAVGLDPIDQLSEKLKSTRPGQLKRPVEEYDTDEKNGQDDSQRPHHGASRDDLSSGPQLN